MAFTVLASVPAAEAFGATAPRTSPILQEFLADENVVAGRPTAIVGHLLAAGNRQPLAGRGVQLLMRTQDGSGPWTAGRVVTSDRLGRVVFNEASTVDTDYALRFTGDATLEPVDSNVRRVRHAPPVSSWQIGAIQAVAGDGAVDAYWSPPATYNGAELDHYELGIGDPTGCATSFSVPRSTRRWHFSDQRNGHEVAVCIRPVSAAGRGALGGSNATPEVGKAMPPAGDLCGVLPVGTSVVRAGNHILCPLGLTVPIGASLVFDATDGPIGIHPSFFHGIVSSGGDISTVGTSPSRRVTLSDSQDRQWLGLRSISRGGVGSSPSVIDLADTTMTTAGLYVSGATSLSLHRVAVSGMDDGDAYPGPLRDGAGQIRSVDTPTVMDTVTSSNSEVGGIGVNCACPVRLSHLLVDGVQQVGISVHGTDDLVLHHATVRNSGTTGPVPVVALSSITASLGPGADVDDITGSGNAVDGMFVEGTVTRSFTWVPVTNQPTDHPLGYLGGAITMTHDTTLTVPPDATVATLGLTLRDGARLDASRGGHFFSIYDPRVTPRLCGAAPTPCATDTISSSWAGIYLPESGTSAVLDGVDLNNPRVGVDVRTEGYRAGTVAIRNTAISHCTIAVNASVQTESAKSSRVLMDNDTISDCSTGVIAGGSGVRVTRSSFTGYGQLGSSVGISDVGSTQVTGSARYEANEIHGFAVGVQTSGSDKPVLRCLDITGNTYAGLYTTDVVGDPTALTSSNLHGNGTVGGYDVDNSSPVVTDDVWWGQPGGPLPTQVRNGSTLTDNSPRLTPSPGCEPTPPTAPDPPFAQQATPAADGVHVSWQPPLERAAVTGFRVTTTPPTTTLNVPATATSAVVPGLSAGTSYTINIASAANNVTSPTAATRPVIAESTPPTVTALKADRTLPTDGLRAYLVTGTSRPGSTVHVTVGSGQTDAIAADDSTFTAIVTIPDSAPEPSSASAQATDVSGTAGTAASTPLPLAPAAASGSPPRMTLSAAALNVGAPATVTVTGTPGQAVQLLAYSRPSTTYQVVRSGQLNAAGAVSFAVAPRTNTRLFVRTAGGASPSQVISVRPAESLRGTASGRHGVFHGQIVPGHAGVSVRLFTVTAGTLRLIGTSTTDANGAWSYARDFSTRGVVTFISQTLSDLTNLAGQSNRISVTFA